MGSSRGRNESGKLYTAHRKQVQSEGLEHNKRDRVNNNNNLWRKKLFFPDHIFNLRVNLFSLLNLCCLQSGPLRRFNALTFKDGLKMIFEEMN